MNRSQPQIAVLGGGPAGLASAHYARKAGLSCELHEAASSVGGNARTLRFGEFLIDTGAHRLHDRDPAATALARELLGADLLRVDAPSKLFYDGRLLDFPLAPLDLLRRLPMRTIATIARENVAMRLRGGEASGESFGALARGMYGDTLAGFALLEYSRKLWGRDPDTLMPEVAGSRLARLDLRTFLVESFVGRGEARRHLDGAFLYPRLGIGQLFDRLGERLDAVVNVDSPVTRIEHRDGAITGVEIRGERVIAPAHVINTLPLGLIARLLDPIAPASVLEAARSIAFRQLRLCIVLLARDRFSPNASIYFPDREIPFTRLYESKNRSSAMAPTAATSLVLELPCEIGDELWQLDSIELRRRILHALEATLGIRESEVIDVRDIIVANAYPVLEISSAPYVLQLREYLDSFTGMTLVGRNARFRYSSIHDMFRGARVAIDSLTAARAIAAH